MNKYIDAEKLIAEIERYKQGAAIARFDNAGENADYFQGKVDLCDDLTHIITSLQQEQPEGLHFTPLNRLIQKIPSEKWNDSTNNYAKKLRDCLIKEGYLKDAKVLQDYISYMNGNNVPMATMDEQEQPEVDLVAELEHHLATTPNEQLEKEWKELEPWNNIGPTVQEFLYGKQPEANLEKIIGQTYHDGSVADTSDMDLVDYENIALHFYELGLNARKEESHE